MATSPWETPAAGQGSGEHVPWPVEKDDPSPWWRRSLRAGALVVLVLLAAVGGRALLSPPGGGEGDPRLPVEVTFDVAAAQGAAARVVTAALAWDEDHPGERLAAIALDYVGQDRSLGWSGKGRQAVENVIAGQVDVLDEVRARVSVSALVRTYTRTGTDAPWEPTGAPTAVTVQVPVSLVDARAVVTGAPVLVGHPAIPEQVPAAGDRPSEDGALTERTGDQAAAFFEAYAAGDVSAVEAPGADISAPGAGWTLVDLRWRVFEGTGSTRSARAQVTWALADGAQLVQTYAVTLSRVTAGGADRWQVSAVTATH